MTQQEKIAHLREFYPALHENLVLPSLFLHDCERLAALPDSITIVDDFDLHGSPELKEVPKSLTVGGRFNISGCMGLANAVYGCGKNSRTICAYRQPSGKIVVCLDCFVGDEAECVAAIGQKYEGAAAADYIAKVRLAFQLFHQSAP